MRSTPMGKGLNAILKAPEKLKPVGRTAEVTAEEIAAPEVATKEVIAAKVITEEVTASEVANEDVTAKEGFATEVTSGGADTTEAPGDEATKKATTPKLTARGVTINQDIISRAVSDAKRSPRISTWSPVAVSTLKFLRMTQPQFSMSDEMRTLIEEGLAKKYPKLVEKIKKELEKSS
jgi:hypothetical protein